MNRVFTKKPLDDQKLKFAPMGSKPGISKLPAAVPTQKKKLKKVVKPNAFAKKAATALAAKE